MLRFGSVGSVTLRLVFYKSCFMNDEYHSKSMALHAKIFCQCRYKNIGLWILLFDMVIVHLVDKTKNCQRIIQIIFGNKLIMELADHDQFLWQIIFHITKTLMFISGTKIPHTHLRKNFSHKIIFCLGRKILPFWSGGSNIFCQKLEKV